VETQAHEIHTAAPIEPRWLWHPNLIVFVSSACTMVLELVAGRIVAPYVGVSLYTWTSIIGVVLAGISLGNYLGGRLADRWASGRLLGAVLSLGGVSSLGILTADLVDKVISYDQISAGQLSLIVGIVVLTAVLFLLPCTLLGMISPIVARLAVRDLAQAGSTVGQIYASGAIGSIIGTFATGFVLISWFGTHRIVLGVASFLLAVGLVFFLASRKGWIAAVLLTTVVGAALVWRQPWLDGPCLRETNYFCIRVQEEEHDGRTVKVLLLDRLVHSYTSIDEPTHLVYDYERAYAQVTAYKARDNESLDVLFIGGGGYTFPRYVKAVYPQAQIQVIEIDPEVTEVAHEQLGLSRDTQITTHNEDARLFFQRTPSQRFDLVFGDAFNDFSVPYHLTTHEFDERVRSWLKKDGFYVVNIIDGANRHFLRAFVQTLRETFQYVYLAPSIESWREASRSTFVIIAGDTPLDRNALALARLRTPAVGDAPTRLSKTLLGPSDLDALLAEGRTVMLTDRYAPVDQLLASVFLAW